MDTYTVIYVEESAEAPYWTVVDLSSGQDFRDAHRFASKQEAEEMADAMNGKLAGGLL